MNGYYCLKVLSNVSPPPVSNQFMLFLFLETVFFGIKFNWVNVIQYCSFNKSTPKGARKISSGSFLTKNLFIG